jgi:heat shock protein HslJ
VTSRTPKPGGILLLLTVALLVAACGSSGSSSPSGSGSSGSAPTAADLDGHTFTSTAVDGHDLVAGSSVRLTFEHGSMSANAGCNTMSSSYDVSDGTLAWTGHPMATMMGCSEDLMKQDTWLSGFLEQGAAATLDGDDLTLSGGDVTMHLQRKQAEPASALMGRTWTVTELVSGSSVSSVPSGVEAPTLEIADDGSTHVFTGCNRGNTTVTADGATATFSPVATTKMACPPPASEVEQAVLRVLDGQVDVTVDGTTATLTNGEHGLVLTSS